MNVPYIYMRISTELSFVQYSSGFDVVVSVHRAHHVDTFLWDAVRAVCVAKQLHIYLQYGFSVPSSSISGLLFQRFRDA